MAFSKKIAAKARSLLTYTNWTQQEASATEPLINAASKYALTTAVIGGSGLLLWSRLKSGNTMAGQLNFDQIKYWYKVNFQFEHKTCVTSDTIITFDFENFMKDIENEFGKNQPFLKRR